MACFGMKEGGSKVGVSGAAELSGRVDVLRVHQKGVEVAVMATG